MHVKNSFCCEIIHNFYIILVYLFFSMKETHSIGKFTLSCYQIVLIADPYSDLKMLRKNASKTKKEVP